MCAINGIYAYRATDPVSEAEVITTRDSMARRGPQAAGFWTTEDRRVAFGHRRLAIIDLSEEGNQPMSYRDAGLTITFNGEIYNFRELRSALEADGAAFRTNSDTEVILHLYTRYGPAMLSKLRGMFALALWDSLRQTLLLARDPFGIKPLYYTDDGGTFRFASQVKGLLSGGEVDTRPDPAGHTGFFLWGHIPEPYTLYRSILQLPAGTWMTVTEHGASKPTSFLDPLGELRNGSESGGTLRETLLDSVRHHFVADVPVSLFLSAGRDSCTLLGLASELESEPIRAVTLAFEEYAGRHDDEAPLAAEVARLYGAKHDIDMLTRDTFEAQWDDALMAMDQPSVDGFNTYFVSKAAAAGGTVRVALSGLGADELFGGYPSFQQVPKLSKALTPTLVAPGVFRGLNRAATSLGIVRGSRKYGSILEYGGTIEGAYLLRRALFLPDEIEELFDPAFAREGLGELDTLATLRRRTEGIPTAHAKVCALETTAYMRDRLLRDSDWAGMAHSLEIRVPFVDVELMRRLGGSIASKRPPSKHDMASTPRTPLPASVLDRAKTGFTIPIREWVLDHAKAEAGGASGGAPYRALARLVYQSVGKGFAEDLLIRGPHPGPAGAAR